MRKTSAADTMIGGIDLAGEIARGMASAKVGSPATLIRRTSRAPETHNLAGGTRALTTSIPCRGLRDELMRDGKRTVTVTLFGATILLRGERIVPIEGDAVTIRGETFQIIAVEDDPAAATYVCTAAGPGSGLR